MTYPYIEAIIHIMEDCGLALDKRLSIDWEISWVWGEDSGILAYGQNFIGIHRKNVT